jgi:hypothetical protein
MQSSNKVFKKFIFWVLILAVCGFAVYWVLPMASSDLEYKSGNPTSSSKKEKDIKSSTDKVEKTEDVKVVDAPLSTLPVTHVATPENVRAVYMSAWVAGGTKFRDPIVKLIDDTELNAVVIDIKDSTGIISFHLPNPELKKYGAMENRIPNIRALTNMLHQKNIYVIGRISVFQDPYMTKHKPEWAITKLSDGMVWKDRKGLSFLNPTNKEVHDYIVALSKDSYAEGFDEINYDYIRYPTDGNMKDINYNLKPGQTRSDNIANFFKYLSGEMKKDTNIPMSADLFGLTTEVKDDMGIGQVWEKALPYFDYLAPMVYPSHYPAGTGGFAKPAEHPYEIIDRALESAVARTKAAGYDIKKVRPWLQDFNLGATYTKELIRAQMKATYDNGLDSWMLWDPANTYTASALEPKQ